MELVKMAVKRMYYKKRHWFLEFWASKYFENIQDSNYMKTQNPTVALTEITPTVQPALNLSQSLATISLRNPLHFREAT